MYKYVNYLKRLKETNRDFRYIICNVNNIGVSAVTYDTEMIKVERELFNLSYLNEIYQDYLKSIN